MLEERVIPHAGELMETCGDMPVLRAGGRLGKGRGEKAALGRAGQNEVVTEQVIFSRSYTYTDQHRLVPVMLLA